MCVCVCVCDIERGFCFIDRSFWLHQPHITRTHTRTHTHIWPRGGFSSAAFGDPLLRGSDVIIRAHVENVESEVADMDQDIVLSNRMALNYQKLRGLAFPTIQFYSPFLEFGILQGKGQSEMELLRPPASTSPGSRLFAAYASRHCNVPFRNTMYKKLHQYVPRCALPRCRFVVPLCGTDV